MTRYQWGTRMGKMLAALVALAALGLCVTACGDKSASDRARDTGEAVGDAAKATGEAVGGAMEATGEYLNQSRDADVKAAQATLDGLEKKWQDLLVRATPSTDEGKADLEKAKNQMNESLTAAKAKLAEAKDASDDAWQQDIKPGLDTALKQAQKLYEDVSARFGGQ